MDAINQALLSHAKTPKSVFQFMMKMTSWNTVIKFGKYVRTDYSYIYQRLNHLVYDGDLIKIKCNLGSDLYVEVAYLDGFKPEATFALADHAEEQGDMEKAELIRSAKRIVQRTKE